MFSLIAGSLPLLISIAISIFLYKRLRPSWIRIFTWYMIFSFLVSIVGYEYSSQLKKSNHFIFNIYVLIEFLFFFLVFYKTFETKKLKQVVVWVSIVFTAFTIGSFLGLFYKDGFYVFNSPAYMIGSVLTILFCLLYFSTLFKSEGFINYFKIPMFWIATGLLFYFIGNFIYLGTIDYIIEHNLDKEGTIYRFIMFTLNLLLYTLVSIGFLSNQSLKLKP